MKVGILGCGPSGLLAAHASARSGHDVTVMSKKRKSPMPGTMHLHDAIPGLTDNYKEFDVVYLKTGTGKGYAQKVYGRPDAPVSFDQFSMGARPSWSMRSMYDKLWDDWHDDIVNREATSWNISDIENEFDLLISSIPAQVLCDNHYHSFPSQKVWLGDRLPKDLVLPDNTVFYNGDPLWTWYRASLIDGHAALESTVAFPGAHTGVKPLDTNCDCNPKVKRVGRFGQWKKGVLVHHAYRQAVQHLAEAVGTPSAV